MDMPAWPLKAILQMTLITAAPMMTPESHFQFLCQAAVSSITKNKGTDKLMMIFGRVQGDWRYAISKARNSITRGWLVAGAGNHNMLVNKAKMEPKMPARLFLKAETAMGIINKRFPLFRRGWGSPS